MEITCKTTKEARRKKWLAKKKSIIRLNRSKLRKTFAIPKKKSNPFPRNSTHEFEFFSTAFNSGEWGRKTDVVEEVKEGWNTLKEIENFPSNEKPENRKFWRSKKPENDNVDANDMWTFCSKKCSVTTLDNTRQDLEDQEKVFWKTSKMSFPITMREPYNKNQNMLWRSLQHLQRLYKDNYMDMQQISEIFNLELQKMSETNTLQVVNDCFSNKNKQKPPLRKARLSDWTFLRHDKTRKSDSVKSKSNQFFAKRRHFGKSDHKKFARYKSSNRGTSYRGRLEDDAGSCSSESCKCSCCSCEKCKDDLNEESSVGIVKHIRLGNAPSDIVNRGEEMAPNSEEDAQLEFQNKRDWGMEFANKEPLRPPVYNPEDYAASLKKWGKKGNSGMQLPLYLSQSTGSIERISAELSLQNKRQSSPSTKSSSSIKSGDDKQSKKELTLKMEKKDLKNKENINRGLKNNVHKDFLNPILALSTQEGEMTLRQFSSVTELLGKLKVDLKLSFPSFVQEFVGDPIDGVTLILELLRAVQLSQANQQQRCPPQILRRALLDEHSCLVCLQHCLRCSDAPRRLASSPAGLFTLGVCIMSNVTQSRIIALELLTKACEPTAGGHKAVSEALSTLRLRFGEPVRFRFLVGMLSSAGAVELLATAMKFINVFVETAPSIQQKVYIQAELEQAGFDSKVLRKTLPSNSESVKVELNKWDKNYFDVEELQNKVVEANVLQEKIQLLEKRVQILQEEKGILQSLEQCLKERCSELEEEVSIKTTTTAKSAPSKSFRNYTAQQNKRNTEKGESTPAEDEGISSSEQELSQDEDYIKGAIPYSNTNGLEPITNSKESKNSINSGNDANRFLNKTSEIKITNNCNLKNFKNTRSKMKETNVDDGNEIIQTNAEDEEEEETTIDEVIEELENIVNDAETEAYAIEEQVKFKGMKPPPPHFKTTTEITTEDKCRPYMRQNLPPQENIFEESEIVPGIIHPQPPKKVKSLIHIYFPGEDFEIHDRIKSEFFDEDTDSESSDSLLTAAREKSMHKPCHRSLEVSDSFNSFSSVNTRTLFIKQEEELEESELIPKLGYQERNIDEEEIKRKHLKNNFQYKPQPECFPPEVIFKHKKIRGGSTEGINESIGGVYEKTTVFQGLKSSVVEKLSNECPFTRTPKLVPTPVKRSQTFHITTSDVERRPYKRNEVKPKPKMGVSGLDFQRSAEQKGKNDQGKYQGFEYKKNSERKPDSNDRYSKRVSKDMPKPYDKEDIQTPRRGSFDAQYSAAEVQMSSSNRGSNTRESTPSFLSESSVIIDKTPAKLKSKSLEKMDEGLDSLVDIVISTDKTRKQKPRNEWSVEVTKNIGPRTRRSLAESSLFSPQCAKSFNKVEESPKPPKPAQRTSLARNNSSSTPLHLPIEIKLTPVQPKQQQQFIYNFGMKQAKSEDSLLTSSPPKRYPPDGSSNPMEYKTNQENQKPSGATSPIYSTPSKPSKIQKFFGNPKFEDSSNCDQVTSSKYFESNYACAANPTEKPVNPTPRNIQKVVSSSPQKVKQLITPPDLQKMTPKGYKAPVVKDNQHQSRPNFLLGTYQSQSTKNTAPKPLGNSSVLHSINAFNNNTFITRNSPNNSIYPGTKPATDPLPKERKSDNISNRKSSVGSSPGLEKVTDSPSGLY